MRKPDVGDNPVAKKGPLATERAINELVGKHDVEGAQLFAQAADGARRDDRLHAEHLEAEDVGAEV